jgi:predicted enzyme related to lactoylglutathione lyase
MANIVGWFEVAVTDMGRAKKFYGAVLGARFEKMPMSGMEMESFAGGDMESYGSPGALVKSEQRKPSQSGTLVYFTCDSVAEALKRVEKAGGKVVMPETSIGEYGFIGAFIDTEGNRLCLHCPPKM